MRLLPVLLAVLVLAACAPAFEPSSGAAPGVTVTLAGATITVDASPALTRLFLRVPAATLASPNAACSEVDGAVECIAHDTTSLTVELTDPPSLDPSKPLGVACRDECYVISLPN